MSPLVILGAVLLAAAVPMSLFAVSGKRTVGAAALQRGLGPVVDVRVAVLQHDATDRLLAPLVQALARRARRLTPAGMADRLEQKLVLGGLAHRFSVDQVLAVKLGMSLFFGLFGGMIALGNPSPPTFGFLAVSLFVSWFGPDGYIDGRVSERRKAVQVELPNSMDQITIAVEAGLAFEAAMARVAAEADSVLAMELSRTLQDIQLGVPRADALSGLASRVDVPELKHFVTSMRQAEQYGVPIANVLRVQAAELREKRRQAAEELAMKLPVKILFPLVFCILPTMFVVILGPAAMRMMNGL